MAENFMDRLRRTRSSYALFPEPRSGGAMSALPSYFLHRCRLIRRGQDLPSTEPRESFLRGLEILSRLHHFPRQFLRNRCPRRMAEQQSGLPVGGDGTGRVAGESHLRREGDRRALLDLLGFDMSDVAELDLRAGKFLRGA